MTHARVIVRGHSFTLVSMPKMMDLVALNAVVAVTREDRQEDQANRDRDQEEDPRAIARRFGLNVVVKDLLAPLVAKLDPCASFRTIGILNVSLMIHPDQAVPEVVVPGEVDQKTVLLVLHARPLVHLRPLVLEVTRYV